MTVHFIGAGPGAADLITVRGRDILARASLCLYPGSLTPPELLGHCPAGARTVDTAELTLDEIIAALVGAHPGSTERSAEPSADTHAADAPTPATAEPVVARLCSGDPSLYSAVAEQMRRLDAARIAYEVVPGVPAFAAAAAALGRELTVPTVGQSVILTRTQARSTSIPAGQDLATLAASGATMVVHLAIGRIEQVVEQLLPSYGPACPAAVVAHASQPEQVVLRAPLSEIAEAARAANLSRAATIIVGDVLAAEAFPDSFLYSKGRDRRSAGSA